MVDGSGIGKISTGWCIDSRFLVQLVFQGHGGSGRSNSQFRGGGGGGVTRDHVSPLPPLWWISLGFEARDFARDDAISLGTVNTVRLKLNRVES